MSRSVQVLEEAGAKDGAGDLSRAIAGKGTWMVG